MNPEIIIDACPADVDFEENIATAEADERIDDHVFLAGRPPLQEFLSFVSDLSTDKESVGNRALIEDWNAAAERVQRLTREERGWADHPPIGALDSRLEPLKRSLFADPLFQHSFSTVRTEVGVIELDRLVVYQKHIDLSFARRLAETLPQAPGPEDIFRFCLPFDHPRPPVKWMRTSRSTFAFYSPSNDMRYLGTMFLKPENIVDHPPPGTLVGVVGLAVGFGSNFLNAIHVENRLVLNNGSHRAFTLRRMGITHVPCIIQHVSSRDELSVVASSDLKRHPERYLEHPRPSVLKDYLDPGLLRVVPVPRRWRQVRVTFSSDERYVPSL